MHRAARCAMNILAEGAAHVNSFVRVLAQPTTAGRVRERLVQASVIGNPDRPIRAIGALSTDAEGVLAFCDAERADDALRQTTASVVIVRKVARMEMRVSGLAT